MCIAITLSLFSIHWRLLGWKSAFAIMCSIAFCWGGGVFEGVGFFFASSWILIHAYSIYNVWTEVCKGKIQILQFIRNVGQHIFFSVINHFILSYIYSIRQLEIVSWKKNNFKIWSNISFWIPYRYERYFFVTTLRNRSFKSTTVCNLNKKY